MRPLYADHLMNIRGFRKIILDIDVSRTTFVLNVYWQICVAEVLNLHNILKPCITYNELLGWQNYSLALLISHSIVSVARAEYENDQQNFAFLLKDLT